MLPAVDEVGLADERAREADVGNVRLVQYLVDFLYAAQTSHKHHRNLDALCQKFCCIKEIGFVQACSDAATRSAIGAHFDGIDARLGQQLAADQEVLSCQAAKVFIGAIDFHGDAKTFACLVAHVVQDFQEDLGTATLVAAKAVGTMIQERTDELAEVEEMRRMNLHAV